jgi:hypothetical protein
MRIGRHLMFTSKETSVSNPDGLLTDNSIQDLKGREVWNQQ